MRSPVHARWFTYARGWVEPMARGAAKARTLGLAAEMSFWLFVSVVPLAAVAGMVAARLALRRELLSGGVLASMPPETRKLIQVQLERVAAWHGSAVAPIALGVFVWLAATGVHSIFDVLEVQTGAERPWWKKRLLAIATCIGLSLGIAILGVLTVGIGRLEGLMDATFPRDVPHLRIDGTVAAAVLRKVVGELVTVMMVASIYRVGIPREARARVPVWPGAILAVILIAALGRGYRIYLSTTGGGYAYEGGLAIIGATLMTLWLFSVALLLGAELNKVAGDRRAARGQRGENESESGDAVARSLPRLKPRWLTSGESWFRRTLPRPPIGPSSGRSRSPSGSVRG